MNLEILGARPNVGPLVIIEDDATDATVLADPISQDRNERKLSAGWNLFKNCRVPDRYVGVIVTTGRASLLFYIDDAASPKDNAGVKTRFTQCQGYVILALKMFDK